MTMHSISGGADWVNIMDNIIIVHRTKNDKTLVTIEKVRDQEVDSIGEFMLEYNKYTRDYTLYDDVLEEEDF